MDEQPTLVAESGQPLSSVGVWRAFGNMDVDADAVAAGEVRRSSQGVVGAGERRVYADVSPTPSGEEAIVLREAAPRPIDAVTVGDAVAAADAHSDLGAGRCDDIERAFDGIGRFVVVNDRSAAGLQRFERAEFRRPLQHLEIERSVEAPPHQLEDLSEAAWRARRRRHSPRQRRVQVMVRAHQARR